MKYLHNIDDPEFCKMVTLLTFPGQTIRKIGDYLKMNNNVLRETSMYLRKFSRINDYNQIRWKRNAEEIATSGEASGCNDLALVFCSLGKYLGYSNRLVNTWESENLKNIVTGKGSDSISGHFFVDIHIDGKWHQYDPTLGFCRDGYKKGDMEFVTLAKGLDTSEMFFRKLDDGKDVGYEKEAIDLRHMGEKLKNGVIGMDRLRQIAKTEGLL